jgi:Fe-S-cluster containining protein
VEAHDPVELDAGDFASWLERVTQVIHDGGAMDVPCNGCTACCRSSQFVAVEPDEHEALDVIPPALLFPAPGRPAGHVVLGYDEHGRCPLLVDDRCSIYEHRPRACRTYDCRIFAATSVVLDDESKRAISDRVRRWRFRYASLHDRERHEALRTHAARSAEPNPTARAIGAIAGTASRRGGASP